MRRISVVGAGPVGSVAALACARFGHTVTLLEAQERIDDSPRASTTQARTLEILDHAAAHARDPRRARPDRRVPPRRAGGAHLRVLGPAEARAHRGVRFRAA